MRNHRETSVDLMRLLATTEGAQTENDRWLVVSYITEFVCTNME